MTSTVLTGLTIPVWKERTETTHQRHLQLLEANPKLSEGILFLGDSMFERWMTTGKQWWNGELKQFNIMNAGVGGDKIENLMWRISPPTDKKQNPLGITRGILDGCNYKKIFLMIGTNNLTVKRLSAEIIAAAVTEVIDIIKGKQPNAQLIVFALTPRSDVPFEKIAQINTIVSLACGRKSIPYIDFNKKLTTGAYFDDQVHLSTFGYEEWFNAIMPPLLCPVPSAM